MDSFPDVNGHDHGVRETSLLVDSAGALLLPPLIFGSLIFLAWLAHLWGVEVGALALLGIPWGMSIGFRFVSPRAGTTAAWLYCVLLLLVFIVGGFGFACLLWSSSDGTCI